tara:strand:+ start:875 stop:2071 length:1197 start_codon:yes stop_codon:yes gene_type:complete
MNKLSTEREAVFDSFINIARSIYSEDFIPLHRPIFYGNEKTYLSDCIDSNFVSSVGEYVNKFENLISEYVGSKFGIAIVNGTNAIHLGLLLLGVKPGEEVITQSLTFVATTNAIHYCNADPVFLDVDRDTMGLSPKALKQFLEHNCEQRKDGLYNKISGKKVSACISMHTFGLCGRIDEIVKVCKEFSLPVLEDAAESLGSFYKNKHSGTFGDIGVFSFNGNKLLTTGGGGMIVTNNAKLAKKAKHLSTTAKVPHAFEFNHDQVGYNYRMPNINAALGCAQIERIQVMLDSKKSVTKKYIEHFKHSDIELVKPINSCVANNWLNAIILNSKTDRDNFLTYTNNRNVMTRPIWKLTHSLPMNKNYFNDGLKNSFWLEERVVNIPSSVPINSFNKFIETF